MSVAELVLVSTEDGKHLHLTRDVRSRWANWRGWHYTRVERRVKRKPLGRFCAGWQPTLRSVFFCGEDHDLAVADPVGAAGVFDFADNFVGSLVVDPHYDFDLW